MAYCWTTIHVADLAASIKFYETAVGLRVLRKVEPRPGVAIAFLGFGDDENETQVELLCDQNALTYPDSKQITMGFTVDSLKGKMDFLKVIGIEPESEIFEPNPRIKFFYVKDPDNVRVQFVENVDPDAVKDI